MSEVLYSIDRGEVEFIRKEDLKRELAKRLPDDIRDLYAWIYPLATSTRRNCARLDATGDHPEVRRSGLD